MRPGLANYEIVQVAIEELQPDPANPRRTSDEQLEALTRSLRAFGFVQPVLARTEDKRVIGGHQRLLAARRLGYKTVPVIYLGGEWDQELLARLVAGLKPVEDLDLSLSGFSQDELIKLLKSLDVREKKELVESFDLDEALDAARAAPHAQRGEIWALGDHRLACGDACDPADVSRLLQGRQAAMAFTDPPYNAALGDHGGQQKGQRRRRIENDALAPEEWEAFVRRWADNLVASVDGAMYVCMSTKEWPSVSRALDESGAHWSDTIIWAKDRFVLGRADYQRQYEPIWYGWRDGMPHFWRGDRDQGDVWRIDRPTESDLHPTMKPLALVERALENSSRAGDAILDLFLGSGTTLIAAERTGRVCLGMEIDERYASVAILRWKAFTGEIAERAG